MICLAKARLELDHRFAFYQIIERTLIMFKSIQNYRRYLLLLILFPLFLSLSASRSYASSKCTDLFGIDFNASINLKKLKSRARSEFKRAGVEPIKPYALNIYYQSLFIKKNSGKKQDKSTLMVVTEPLFAYSNEQVRLGLIMDLNTRASEMGLIKESINSKGESTFARVADSGFLALSSDARKAGFESVKKSIDEIELQLKSKFPFLQFNKLYTLGTITVFSKNMSIRQKIEFISELQSIASLDGPSKLGFTFKDVVMGGEIILTEPAVDITDFLVFTL